MTLEVYNVAQTFYVDPDTVKGAASVGISSVDLYFKRKPNPAVNKSSIFEPGVTVFICETTPEKIPVVSGFGSGLTNETAYVEYALIATSADGSLATKFKFDKPVIVQTAKEYALVVKFDGNDEFILWTSKQGDLLVGTNKISPGPSGKFVGNYYTTTYVQPNSNTEASSSTWKSVSDTDLKFKISIARYSVNGVAVSNNTVSSTLGAGVPIYGTTFGTANVTYNGNSVTFHISTNHYEYIKYDKKNSRPEVKGGELVYQNTVFWPGGANTSGGQGIHTVSVSRGSTLITAGETLPNGQSFNWNNIYGSANNTEYIVIVSLNDDQPGERRTDIRKIVSVDSNTVLRVDEAMNFSNSAAYFIKSPVARVSRLENHHHHDRNHKNFNRGYEKRRKV